MGFMGSGSSGSRFEARVEGDRDRDRERRARLSELRMLAGYYNLGAVEGVDRSDLPTSTYLNAQRQRWNIAYENALQQSEEASGVAQQLPGRRVSRNVEP
jgi:hypothetical protein